MRHVPRPKRLQPISTDPQRVKRALYLLHLQHSIAAQSVAAQVAAAAPPAARRVARHLQKYVAEVEGLINLAARKRCPISEVTPDDAMRLGPFMFDKEKA